MSIWEDIAFAIYPWVKSIHIMAVMSWMAGLFYLPRLFVHHAERAGLSGDTHDTFVMMEQKLLGVIMNPAMVVTWICGLIMVFTPGIVDWNDVWPWTKTASVLAMTWFHYWLVLRRRDFMNAVNTRDGRTYRIMNEVPTVLMIVIVFSVVVKF